MSNKEKQAEKFMETARRLKCDEDEASFEEQLIKIVNKQTDNKGAVADQSKPSSE